MPDSYEYYVYILTNQHNTVLYTGVTNNIYQRVNNHKAGKGGKFSAKYKLNKLVYYELFDDIYDAIAYEKQIKAGTRQKKIDLINEMNPDWRDLFEDLQF
jgi:putative endonuclease